MNNTKAKTKKNIMLKNIVHCGFYSSVFVSKNISFLLKEDRLFGVFACVFIVELLSVSSK